MARFPCDVDVTSSQIVLTGRWNVFRGVFDAEEDDDDDELGRVEAEAVPNEVRDWLAQTFTRSTAGGASKRFTGDSKPRFRSVANAIRAGILVDRQVQPHYPCVASDVRSTDRRFESRLRPGHAGNDKLFTHVYTSVAKQYNLVPV